MRYKVLLRVLMSPTPRIDLIGSELAGKFLGNDGEGPYALGPHSSFRWRKLRVLRRPIIPGAVRLYDTKKINAASQYEMHLKSDFQRS